MRKLGTKGGKGSRGSPGSSRKGASPSRTGRGVRGGGPALQAWARRDSYSDMGSFVAAAAADAGFNAAACRDPQPLRGPSPHATRPRAALPPPSPVRPPSPKSSGGSEAARPLPGTPAPRPTCAGGGELSRGASEANRSAARRMRTSSHFPAPPPRLAKFAGNLPGRAPTGSGGRARVHRAGGGGRQPRVLAAPEGPPGPAALAPPLRPPAPPAR